MPIISDGNNQIGDEVTDQHMTVGVTKHTGSYHVSGSTFNYILANSDDMSFQLSVAPGGANVTVAPHIGAFDNTLGVQPTIAVGRGDDTKTAGGQFALSRISSTGSVGHGDILGTLAAFGHDGTDFNTGAEIKFSVDGTVATDRLPSKIELLTNPGDGSTVFPNSRMTIESNGNIGINSSGQKDKLYVNGSVGVGSTGAGDLNLKVTGSAIISGDKSGGYILTVDNDNASSAHGLKVTSDGNGSATNIFDVESDSETLFRVRGDGRVGIGKVTSLPSAVLTVSSSNSDSDLAIAHKIHHIGDSDTSIAFDANGMSFEAGGSTELKVSDSAVLVKQHIKHIDDEDTLISFADNKIVLKAGNIALVTAEKNSSAPHEVTINDGSNNVDFVVKGNGSNQGNPGLKFDASTNKLGINGIGTPAYELEVAGDIGLAEYIYHRGDDNTFLKFDDDIISLQAGGVTAIQLREASYDYITINSSHNDVDTIINGQNQNRILFKGIAQQDSERVLILSGGAKSSPDETFYTDTCFFVSGTIGSKGTTNKGTSVFGGDVNISGSLNLNYGVSTEKTISNVDLSSPSLTQNHRSAVIRATIDGNIANGTEGFSTIQIDSNRITSTDTIMATSDTVGLFLFPSGVTNGRFFISLSNFTGGTISNDSTVQINWTAI